MVVGGFAPRAYAAYLRRRWDFRQAPERKALTFLAISAGYGLTWGLGAFLLLPDLSGPTQGVLLFIVVFGTVMGPYASMPGILYVRLAATGIPTLIAVALHMPPQVALACLVLGVWLLLRTDVWRGYHRALRQEVELQAALEARQAELTVASQRKDEANRRLKAMAETDALTGGANRRHFMERLAQLRGPAALILLDIDYFKEVNDRFGHLVGDRVLVEFVAVVQEALRQGDLLARIGGEEFALLLPQVSPEDALALAERVRETVAANPIEVAGQTVAVTVSLGVAHVPAGQPAGESLQAADAALYAAKGGGRDRVCVAAAGGAPG